MDERLSMIEKAFIFFVMKEDIKALKFFMSMGINLSRETFSPLHTAVAMNKSEIAKLLIEGGADVNLKLGEGGTTPLHLAMIMKSYESAITLLVANADFDIEDSSGKKPFDYAE